MKINLLILNFALVITLCFPARASFLEAFSSEDEAEKSSFQPVTDDSMEALFREIDSSAEANYTPENSEERFVKACFSNQSPAGFSRKTLNTLASSFDIAPRDMKGWDLDIESPKRKDSSPTHEPAAINLNKLSMEYVRNQTLLGKAASDREWLELYYKAHGAYPNGIDISFFEKIAKDRPNILVENTICKYNT